MLWVSTVASGPVLVTSVVKKLGHCMVKYEQGVVQTAYIITMNEVIVLRTILLFEMSVERAKQVQIMRDNCTYM